MRAGSDETRNFWNERGIFPTNVRQRDEASNYGCMVFLAETPRLSCLRVPNQKDIRAGGGYFFCTDGGNVTTGPQVVHRSGACTAFGDRNAKEHIAPTELRQAPATFAAIPVRT